MAIMMTADGNQIIEGFQNNTELEQLDQLTLECHKETVKNNNLIRKLKERENKLIRKGKEIEKRCAKKIQDLFKQREKQLKLKMQKLTQKQQFQVVERFENGLKDQEVAAVAATAGGVGIVIVLIMFAVIVANWIFTVLLFNKCKSQLQVGSIIGFLILFLLSFTPASIITMPIQIILLITTCKQAQQ